MSAWITTPKTRSFRGPFPHSVLLIGRSFDQAKYEKAQKCDIQRDLDACRLERDKDLVESFKRCEREREFFESSDKKVKRAQLRKKVDSELHLHELALEARRDRLRDKLSTEDRMYRDEAVALEPTTLDRMAAGRQLLKELQDRKEKARQQLVKQKYLQQACLQHDDLRKFLWKRLELEADADRKEQVRDKQLQDERRKAMDAVFHQQVLDNVAGRAKREEMEAIDRNRANVEQVKVLLEQIAETRAETKEKKERRIAEERMILLEQMALRKKEEEQERALEYAKKKELHAVYDEDVKRARENRDKLKNEEKIFDAMLLENLLKTLNEEKKEELLRKRELNDEISKYLDYVRSTRLNNKQREHEVNRAIRDDMDRAIEKEMQVWKTRAAASRRLLCDVASAQKVQREEKFSKKGVTKEERLVQRQRVLDECAEIQRLDLEDRRKRRDKQLQYGGDLIGQMGYEQCRRQADRAEEAKLIEQQEIAEQEWNDQLHYLMQNPVAFKRHPIRHKYDEMISSLPASTCMSTR